MGREDRGPAWVLVGLLPLLGLGVLLALIFSNGVGVGRSDAPPVEDLTVGRVTLPTENEFVVHVQNGGPNPVTLKQVVVNDALWDFRVRPDNRILRLGSADVVIPYTWVEGEAYEIVLISETGTTFDAEVPVAVLTPGFSGETFSNYALIGFYVGVVPLTLVGLLGVERLFRREEASRLATSYRIALGIGLHNLGEGLAIGAAFALGEAALGTFLILGFTLHNITEGVGIAAPVLKEKRPRFAHFAALALLGGGPAIVGTWIGGFAYSNLLSAVFLAIGVGAILQVVYEVGRLLMRDSARSKTPALSGTNLGGLTAGIAIMYVTALLVSV